MEKKVVVAKVKVNLGPWSTTRDINQHYSWSF